MQPIGQFDQHHARIVHHRQEHLAQRFQFALVVRSGGLRIEAVELAEFGHAFDQAQHFLAELRFQFGPRDLGVFQHVVQQAGGDGRRVDAQLGQDAGDGQAVLDVGFAGRAFLAGVRRVGQRRKRA